MDTTTLSNALKAVFGTTITSSTSGVANFLAPLFNASGDPAGRIGMSDLASVLGVTGEYKSDFDNAPVNQTVLVAATSPANAPITGVLRGYLTTKDSNSGYKMQLYMECSLPSERGSLFMRALGSGSWTNWERISYDVPTFYKDYSTLAELKAALDAV